MDKHDYFATLPVEQIGDALLEKIDEYYKHLRDIGRTELLLKSYDAYYRPGMMGGNLLRSGNQGEYVNISVNHYRNLIQHRTIMTTSSRPEFEPRAINTDSDSQAACELGKGLLEYYERTKKMERFTNRATEYAVVYAEGFVGTFWSATAGESYGVDEAGQPLKNGDLEFGAYTTFDVIRPVSRFGEVQYDWCIVRRYQSRYSLAAKFPTIAERILAYEEPEPQYDRTRHFTNYRNPSIKEDELIPVYAFFHSKTEAMPEGRVLEFTDNDIVYTDGALPYKYIPLFRIVPNEQEGVSFGYTNAFDLLPLQDALDKLESTVLTNQAAFGVQNIAMPKGSGVGVTQLRGGLNMIEFDSKTGPPVPLMLCATPMEIFNHIQTIKTDMETLIGVNSVARGNPEASLKSSSGSAPALIQSVAIQFAQGLQQSYAELLEDVGTSVIHILQDYATTERVALIVGKANRSYLKSFKGQDLSPISRVIVDMGNPIMRTTAGRVNMAEALLQMPGMIQTPQQYLEVLTSGRLEPIYEGEQAELLLIRSENEHLQNGEMQPVIRTDNHPIHIQEHKSVLANPDARKNVQIVQATLDHIAQHEQFLAPVPQMDANGNQIVGAPPGAASAEMTNPQTPGAGPNMPNLPKNPLTGIRGA